MTTKPRRAAGAARRESSWALDLQLRQLRAFVVLTDTGSLSAAARVLGVAQSTMSEAVSALERALGTRIVARKRGGHGIALTAAGEALLPHARNVLALLEDAHVSVAAADHSISSGIDVIANESISTYALPPALAEVRQQWPQLQFAVSVGICPDIKDGLSAARYDVGLQLQFGAAPSEESSSGRVVISDTPLVLFAASHHPLVERSRPAVPVDSLRNSTVFISDARGCFFDTVRGFFRRNGARGLRLEATGSVEAVKRSVFIDPLRIGVLPAYALAEEFRSDRVRVLMIRPELPRLRIDATVYRARPPLHPAIVELLDAVRRNTIRLANARRAQ